MGFLLSFVQLRGCSDLSYEQWRNDPVDREEDAAYVFGYHLIKNCRDEAMEELPENLSPDAKKAAEEAIDTALHNVADMLEGFFPMEAGPNHSAELVLGVRIRDSKDDVVETVEISPCKVDLPIGYWKWAEDREFR